MQSYPLSAKYCLVVGSIAIDQVATPEAKSGQVLGGSASYASLAASFFSPVRLVGVIGKDFPSEYTELYRKYNIDLAGIHTDLERKTFCWTGRYRENFSGRDTEDVQLNAFEFFSPGLPASYRATPFVLLGAIQPQLQLEVLNQMQLNPKRSFAVADTFDLWIKTKQEELLKLLRRVQLLVINEEEAELITGERNVMRAGPLLRKLGPEGVIIKRGADGAVLFHTGGLFVIPAYPVLKVVDPTGAGDSFVGALVGFLASQGRTDFSCLKRAMAYATATASFTVESFSVDALCKAGREGVNLRYRSLINLTRF